MMIIDLLILTFALTLTSAPGLSSCLWSEELCIHCHVHLMQTAVFETSELWAKPMSQNLEQCVVRSKANSRKCYLSNFANQWLSVFSTNLINLHLKADSIKVCSV